MIKLKHLLTEQIGPSSADKTSAEFEKNMKAAGYRDAWPEFRSNTGVVFLPDGTYYSKDQYRSDNAVILETKDGVNTGYAIWLEGSGVYRSNPITKVKISGNGYHIYAVGSEFYKLEITKMYLNDDLLAKSGLSTKGDIVTKKIKLAVKNKQKADKPFPGTQGGLGYFGINYKPNSTIKSVTNSWDGGSQEAGNKKKDEISDIPSAIEFIYYSFVKAGEDISRTLVVDITNGYKEKITWDTTPINQDTYFRVVFNIYNLPVNSTIKIYNENDKVNNLLIKT